MNIHSQTITKEECKRRADEGEPVYMNSYGKLCHEEKNYKEAVSWFRKAAKKGYGRAQYNLGLAYENGEGVRKCNVDACMWYKLAMEQGHDRARANYNRLIQNMSLIGRVVAKIKAEVKMAYFKLKHRIKSIFLFLKWGICNGSK